MLIPGEKYRISFIVTHAALPRIKVPMMFDGIISNRTIHEINKDLIERPRGGYKQKELRKFIERYVDITNREEVVNMEYNEIVQILSKHLELNNITITAQTKGGKPGKLPKLERLIIAGNKGKSW